MNTHTESDADPRRHWRDLLASERDAETLYSRLAEAESGERRKIFEELASIEHKHAAHWEAKLRDAGAEVPPPGRPSLRTRLLSTAARRLSTQTVLPMIERAERSDAGVYDRDPDAAPGMAADERGHARTLAKLVEGGKPIRASRSRTARAGTAATAPGRCGPGCSGSATAWSRTPPWSWASPGPVPRTARSCWPGSPGCWPDRSPWRRASSCRCRASARCTSGRFSLEARELEENPEEERSELVLL